MIKTERQQRPRWTPFPKGEEKETKFSRYRKNSRGRGSIVTYGTTMMLSRPWKVLEIDRSLCGYWHGTQHARVCVTVTIARRELNISNKNKYRYALLYYFALFSNNLETSYIYTFKR